MRTAIDSHEFLFDPVAVLLQDEAVCRDVPDAEAPTTIMS